MISLSRKCSMASVFAAALFVMAVVSFAVLMIVMMAGFIWIVLQRSVQIGRDDIIRSAVYAGQKLHASFLQRHPRAHANAAADQGLYIRRSMMFSPFSLIPAAAGTSSIL